MAKFIIRRLLQLVLVFFGATIILFSSLFLFGNPFDRLSATGRAPSPVVVKQLEHTYGLDQPKYVQYLKYVDRLVLHGDLGTTYRQGRSVNDVLLPKVGNTAKLAVFAIILEIIIGLVAGVISAVYRYSLIDTAVTLATTVVIGLPVFVIGLVLIEIFSLNLHWFPFIDPNLSLKSYVLPAITLATVDAALIARLTRGSMLEVMRADYVRTATAKGLSRRSVIFKHVLRNSLIPVVTYIGISFGSLLAGALVTETVFNLNGIGNALYSALRPPTIDTPIVMGVVTYGVVVFVIINLLVDLLYAFLDPRVRLD